MIQITLSPLNKFFNRSISGLLEFSYVFFKLVASVLITFEQVETCAAGAKQDGFTFLSHLVGCIDCIFHALYVNNRQSETVEEVVQFLIMQSHEDQTGTFFPNQISYFIIVVPLVLSSQNENRFSFHALQGIPARVDICCFGVVDVFHLLVGSLCLYIRRSQQSCRQKKCRYDSFFVHVIDLLILFFFPYLFFLLCFVPAFQFLLNPPFGNLAVHLFDFKSDVVSSRASATIKTF